MYSRSFTPPDDSYFLFGPRGTGKSTWVRGHYPSAYYVDLLEADTYRELVAQPERLRAWIPEDRSRPVIIDEVQKAPALLDEVHRLIERDGRRFILTGSSARKLKAKGVNLLAGRALTEFMHPLTIEELGDDFSLSRALELGFLPSVYSQRDPKRYLSSYVTTYLKEEVQQEGLTRNIGAFSRFLEVASFSQAAPLNISAVARDCAVERKVVENYVSIIEDLLLAVRLPVFTKRARRALTTHPKLFLFDAGVYRTLRPAGPLDRPEEIDGATLETLVFQQLRALNAYHHCDYQIYFWRAKTGQEVDFVLYGSRGIRAFEVKRAKKLRAADLAGLRAFLKDYGDIVDEVYLLYGGDREERHGRIRLLPLDMWLPRLRELLA